jgi:hypothetical protein
MSTLKQFLKELDFLLIILGALMLLFLIFYATHALAASKSVDVQVSIIVHPYTKLLMEKNLVQIVPTREDIDKGYAEVQGGSVVKLFTNVRQGASLTAHAQGKLVGSRGREIPLSNLMFRVEGEPNYRPFTAEEVLVYKSSHYELGAVKKIDYRLNLGWDTEADTYNVIISYTYNINE